MKNKFFEVLRAGISTTYQDAGRFGLHHLGVAPSGCMDLKSFKIANCLVGNNRNEGVIEFAYQGPLLKLNSGKIHRTRIKQKRVFKRIRDDGDKRISSRRVCG